jgi:S1-C subfamily serine protease
VGTHLRRFWGRHERVLLVGVSVLVSLAFVGGYRLMHPAPRPLTQTDIDGAVRYTLAHTPRGPADSTVAAATIAPSVVEVEGFLSPQHERELAKHGGDGSGGKEHGGAAPGAHHALPATPPAAPGAAGKPGDAGKPGGSKDAPADEPQPAAIGSGVVVDKNGRVLTALHVISGTDHWVVVFADGSKSDADLVGSQPENDLAVLQPHELPDDLPAAALTSTADLRSGDVVVATGYPFGIGPSVSAGVVSGLHREFIDPDNKNVKLTNLIQFDAAVNPGNSGGPLVDREGEVVGIVTAILNPSGAHVFAGIGFAVPIENAMRAIGDNPL